MELSFEVRIRRDQEDALLQLPHRVQAKFWALIEDLRSHGTAPPGWGVIRRVGDNYHCQLEPRWITGWSVRDSVVEVQSPRRFVGRLATLKERS